jgi:hypothetical protein
MALTIGLDQIPAERWHPGFRDTWLGLLDRLALAVDDADAEAIKAIRADLDRYATGLDVRELADSLWPIAGALLINLRNILEALEEVAGAQPVRVPAIARPRFVVSPD